MCARYTVFTEEEVIEIRSIIEEVSRKFGGNAVSKGEIRPTNTAPILALDDNNQVIPYPVSWGFPKWNGKGVIINARVETALEKPMFRESMMARRCVVPSTGYYEWKRIDGKKAKDKYHLVEPDKSILYMAGMIDSFSRPDGTQYEAFTILTTAANESVSRLHNRMPVILQLDEIESWLRDGVFMLSILDRICPALTMTLASENADIQTSLF